MNLNKHHKEAFVRAVIQDVPVIDYDAQALKIVNEWEKTTVPKEVYAVIEKFPGWIDRCYVYLPGNLNSVAVYALKSGNYLKNESPETWEKLTKIAELNSAQSDKISSLQESLTAIIESCRTVKQALERLPEFAAYLPSETQPLKDVPVANLVAELTKAGWPKS